MQEIASKTSISRTSLYSYYSSKEEILLDSMSYHLNIVVEELDKIISELDDSNSIDNNEIVNLLTNLILLIELF